MPLIYLYYLGIGDLEGIVARERSQIAKPNKIFRINTIILQIRANLDDGNEIILHKEPFPNTMFTPSILCALADESDSFAMKVCGEFHNFYRAKLVDSVMCIQGLHFRFINWTGKECIYSLWNKICVCFQEGTGNGK